MNSQLEENLHDDEKKDPFLTDTGSHMKDENGLIGGPVCEDIVYKADNNPVSESSVSNDESVSDDESVSGDESVSDDESVGESSKIDILYDPNAQTMLKYLRAELYRGSTFELIASTHKKEIKKYVKYVRSALDFAMKRYNHKEGLFRRKSETFKNLCFDFAKFTNQRIFKIPTNQPMDWEGEDKEEKECLDYWGLRDRLAAYESYLLGRYNFSVGTRAFRNSGLVEDEIIVGNGDESRIVDNDIRHYWEIGFAWKARKAIETIIDTINGAEVMFYPEKKETNRQQEAEDLGYELIDKNGSENSFDNSKLTEDNSSKMTAREETLSQEFKLDEWFMTDKQGRAMLDYNACNNKIKQNQSRAKNGYYKDGAEPGNDKTKFLTYALYANYYGNERMREDGSSDRCVELYARFRSLLHEPQLSEEGTKLKKDVQSYCFYLLNRYKFDDSNDNVNYRKSGIKIGLDFYKQQGNDLDFTKYKGKKTPKEKHYLELGFAITALGTLYQIYE